MAGLVVGIKCGEDGLRTAACSTSVASDTIVGLQMVGRSIVVVCEDSVRGGMVGGIDSPI